MCGAMQRGAMQCDAMQCHAMQRGAMQCRAARCSVPRPHRTSVRDSMSPVSAHSGAVTRLVLPAPLLSAPVSTSASTWPITTRRPRACSGYTCARTHMHTHMRKN